MKRGSEVECFRLLRWKLRMQRDLIRLVLPVDGLWHKIQELESYITQAKNYFVPKLWGLCYHRVQILCRVSTWSTEIWIYLSIHSRRRRDLFSVLNTSCNLFSVLKYSSISQHLDRGTAPILITLLPKINTSNWCKASATVKKSGIFVVREFQLAFAFEKDTEYYKWSWKEMELRTPHNYLGFVVSYTNQR